MSWLSITVLIYGLLMLGGGIGGYKAAGSLPSLYSGLISGCLLIAAAFVSKTNPRVGFGLAAAVAAVLCVVFVRRYTETQKVMPSLGLFGLSAIVLALLAFGHFFKSNG
ncbi:MAG: TMEM14 family protein [Armatimonadetes bacterium]|nr:TMEM14 family protein [Armatimonadota bacterium]